MLTGTAAGAIEIQDDWVNLSAWAYNDVSCFINEGLLPESFSGINDYRDDITRLQFAELAYSVFCVSNNVGNAISVRFNDTDSHEANMLATHGIVTGVSDYDENYLRSFFPDDKITREDAAVIAFRTGHFRIPFLHEYDEFGNLSYTKDIDIDFTDKAKISDYAKEAVWYLNSIGVISGMTDGAFNPQSSITIEQAISMLYRLYQNLPATPKADGSSDDGSEEITLQCYNNGFSETKRGNRLYIKNGAETVMSFETDMYFNLDCVTHKGKNYILARNFKKRTEVYDMETRKRLFTVPYPVAKVKNGYLYTISSDKGEYLCGLYGFDGKEVLPNEYSEYEIDELAANNFVKPETEYRAPDGWIYYSDAETGYLYKVDSNGENNELITERAVSDIHYANGWLYCISAAPNSPLFAIRPDGSGLTELSNGKSWLILNQASGDYVSSDGYVYYTVNTEYLHSSYADEFGNLTIEDYPFATLWRSKPSENSVTAEQVSEVYTSSNPALYNSKVFFLDDKQLLEDRNLPQNNGTSYVYCFDGKETRCVLEKRVSDLNIRKDENGVSYLSAQTGDLGIEYKIDLNTLKSDRVRDNFQAYRIQNRKTDEYVKIDVYSDENYTFYRNYVRDVIAFSGPGVEITQMEHEVAVNVICRFKNIIYYKKMYSTNGGEGLYAYDMDKKERTKITDNVSDILNHTEISHTVSEGEIIVFADYFGNIYNLAAGSYEPIQVYPHSDTRNYAEVDKIVETSNYSGLRKLGKDGIYSKITDKPVWSWCYAEDGKEIKFY